MHWLQYHALAAISLYWLQYHALAAISLYWLQYHALAVILYVEAGRPLAVRQAMREWPLQYYQPYIPLQGKQYKIANCNYWGTAGS